MSESSYELEHPTTTERNDELGKNYSQDLREYSCDRCSKSFTTKKYLRSHLKTIHESPRLFICPLCGKQLAREKGLNQHVRTIHEGNWSVFCSICGKGFINRCRLKKHCTNVHERSNRFPCSICEKGFTSDAYRLHHMELVHCGDNQFVCMTCQERFSTKNALMNHVFAVHGVEDEGSEAKAKVEVNHSLASNGLNLSMDAQYEEEQPLDLSMKKNRSPTPEFKPNPIKSADFLLQSSAEVSSTLCNRYNCTYCEKSFASKEYLRLHEATVHEGTKAFVCTICGKHFSVHQALRKHFVIQHEGGRPYGCRDCPMKFRTRATLRSHRAIVHTKCSKVSRPSMQKLN